MRLARTIAVLALLGSMAGCFLPPGGHLYDPPVYDEATHGDADGANDGNPSPVPFPSTILGTVSTGPNSDSADRFSTIAPAGTLVEVTCNLISGSGFVEVIIGGESPISKGQCNGEVIEKQLEDNGSFGILVSSAAPGVTDYRLIVRAH